MCEPVSIGIAAVTLAGGVAKGYADKQAAEAHAAAANANAQIAEMAASDALQRGEVEAGRIQMQGEAIAGRQRTGFGASGVDVNQGSAERTVEDTASLTAVDKETARNNAQREAWGLEVQATNLRNEAASAKDQGDLALIGGFLGGGIGAASALVGGAKATGYFRQTGPQPPGEKP